MSARAPFARILAGADGSAAALEAVRRAARLAALSAAALDVVYVVDTHHAQEGDVERRTDEALADARAAAHDVRDVRARILSGDPETVLLAEVVEDGADLLSVGARARGPRGPIRLGRVATRVLREAPVSVLFARPATASFPSRIVCGVDGSDASSVPATLAAEIAAVAGASLLLEHAVPVFDAGEGSRVADEPRPSVETDEAIRAVRALGVEPVLEVVSGRPEHALVEAAERDGADLLVVGHRATRAMARVLLGSVSEDVARRARCSVLVVRTGGASD